MSDKPTEPTEPVEPTGGGPGNLPPETHSFVVRAAVDNASTALAGHGLLHNTVAAMALDVLAAAVVAAGDGHRAARLLGIGERVWELTGRAQMDSPDLLTTRRSHALRIRAEIGDSAYREAYEQGRGMHYEEGLDYAAGGR
ncbi:hypothetical protein [Streptomyces sp. NBC_01483]|uniref:hypothetical protein n=1 Tax=Streptomyces sp. NBC_01483 TaxID=2903883 RepID=UPI002E336764|nr:hypothetical protein [Streptomyces sp. NBC_01483]